MKVYGDSSASPDASISSPPSSLRCALHARLHAEPKPVRALREIGLAADVPADEPTTEGVIAALERHDLTGRRVGVQLYPGNANERFLKFLESAGAEADPVLPYVYASEVDDARVIAVIAEGVGSHCACSAAVARLERHR